MNKQLCVWSTLSAFLAVVSSITLAEPNQVGGTASFKDPVLKIAEAIKKADTAGAEKQAAALAKKVEDLEELMNLFKKRDKGGIGVGSKAAVVVPDGIELKLENMEKNSLSVATLKKEAEALEEMGYVIAAMGMVAKGKPDPKAKGKKDWTGWCDDLVSGGQKFSAAAKSQKAADLKTLAAKVNSTCNACHSEYRDKL